MIANQENIRLPWKGKTQNTNLAVAKILTFPVVLKYKFATRSSFWGGLNIFVKSFVVMRNERATEGSHFHIRNGVGGKNMKTRIRSISILLLAVFAATIAASEARAEKIPCIPAFHEGNIVHFTVVSDNVVGRSSIGIEKAAIPLYSFGEPGDQPQPDVLSLIPGQSGYNPWWRVIAVVVLDGRDVSTNPYTSEEELLNAEEDGKVLLIDTGFFFLCQVLPSCDNG